MPGEAAHKELHSRYVDAHAAHTAAPTDATKKKLEQAESALKASGLKRKKFMEAAGVDKDD